MSTPERHASAMRRGRQWRQDEQRRHDEQQRRQTVLEDARLRLDRARKAYLVLSPGDRAAMAAYIQANTDFNRALRALQEDIP